MAGRCALLQVRRSKTDPEGVVLYIGREAAEALRAIRPVVLLLLDPNVPVFGLSARQIGRRVKAAGLGEGFTGHSGRVGMAQDLVRNGVELLALMSAGRWKSARMPAGTRWPGITRGVEGVNPRPNSQCQGPARLWLSGM